MVEPTSLVVLARKDLTFQLNITIGHVIDSSRGIITVIGWSCLSRPDNDTVQGNLMGKRFHIVDRDKDSPSVRPNPRLLGVTCCIAELQIAMLRPHHGKRIPPSFQGGFQPPEEVIRFTEIVNSTSQVIFLRRCQCSVFRPTNQKTKDTRELTTDLLHIATEMGVRIGFVFTTGGHELDIDKGQFFLQFKVTTHPSEFCWCLYGEGKSITVNPTNVKEKTTTGKARSIGVFGPRV